MDDLSIPTPTARTAFAASLFDGDLPTDWAIGVMDDVLSGTEYGLSEPGDSAGDTSIVGMRDLVDGVVRFEELATVDSGGTDWSAFRLRRGDILLNRTNSPDLVGKVGYVREDFDAVFASYLVRLHVDPQRADAEYVAAWLTSDIAQRALKRLSTRGVSQANINPTEFRRHCPIPIPPLPEQRKIAEILRTWDEALEKLTALRALNIRRRVWFRTHLFTGKVRLPGFTGEWREVPLSAVLHEHGSKSTGAEEVYSVSVHKGLVNQVEHLGRSFSAANTDHYNRVLPGDIVYTKSPTGDFPLGIIKQSKIDREVIVSPLYGVFTPQTYALGVILDALFESPLAARNYLHPLVQKGAKNTIAVTNSQFLEGKLCLPMDPAEQTAIAAIVTASHTECAGFETEIEALTRQKRGLMQKLLTGEWRVNSEKELA
ncbi:restriction endonuclease S subunit [Defluviimonas denitrificans]|jgi:type I restriction enzyme S subunit|uniref:Restriction endonuclease S subunit n=1 Tax=Albidovulum denitrificans TaxID=404881 RepID=A0A2S8SB14_9RHOB|nr:restriction endonuclease subunit S [Defluviimonas denitrificans]PQV57898.1 restriction endonuclease S subunit [Defluviimonas denitrificans]